MILENNVSYKKPAKRASRIDKLVSECLAIEAQSAKEAGALAYMARTLVLATLPHSKPKDHFFQRTNGKLTISMIGNPKFGLPYGSLPRILLSWLTREAKLKKSPVIHLGKNFSSFLTKLNFSRSGGVRGDATRLREQMLKLFSTQISCVYQDKAKAVCKSNQFLFARSFELWWKPDSKRDYLADKSTITLTQDFYEDLIDKPVPIDFRLLQALRRSPLQIDIYLWLTYRFSYLKKPSLIMWNTLITQFGANYANTAQGLRDFRREFLRSLQVVTAMYQGANVEVEENGIWLKPSKTHVSGWQNMGEF